MGDIGPVSASAGFVMMAGCFDIVSCLECQYKCDMPDLEGCRFALASVAWS